MPALALLRGGIASKLVALVLGAALLTSLVSAWVSTAAIESFLRNKIDQKFPSILSSTADHLDLWYSQRRLDVETFARSESVKGYLTAPDARTGGRRAVSEYLGYLLDRFPHYAAIEVLGPQGERTVRAGEAEPLPAQLAQRLGRVSTSQIGPIRDLGGLRVQFISTAVVDGRDRVMGSVHAVLRASALDRLLVSDRLGPSGELFLIGPDGTYLTPARGRAPGDSFARALPARDAPSPATESENEVGERVVGAALRLAAFPWTLVVEESADEAFRPATVAVWKILGVDIAIMLLLGSAAFWMAQSLVRPIAALSNAARRIADGENEVVIDAASSDEEIGILIRTFNRMTVRLKRQHVQLRESRAKIEDANGRLRGQNEELQRVNEVLEQLSITDGLTRLHNHRFFQEHLAREISRVERVGGSLTLVLIDIDNFKQLNDQHGHAAGDTVLCEVARVMAHIVREADVLARYGGEEFALIPGTTDIDGAAGLAEKIRVAISETGVSLVDSDPPARVSVTVSIGVAAYRGDSRALFNDADRALYRAKESGKDCVIVESSD